MQPHAPELEEAVIGACLIEQEALPLIADKLRPEMFYDDHHHLIFAAHVPRGHLCFLASGQFWLSVAEIWMR